MKRWLFLGSLLVAGFDAFSQEPKLVLPVGHNSISNIERYPEHGYIVTYGDGSVKVWSLSTLYLLKDYHFAETKFIASKIFPDGKRIVLVSADMQLIVYELKTDSLVFSVNMEIKIDENNCELSVSPGSDFVLIKSGTIAALWSIKEKKQLMSANSISCLKLSTNDSLLVYTSFDDDKIHIYDWLFTGEVKEVNLPGYYLAGSSFYFSDKSNDLIISNAKDFNWSYCSFFYDIPTGKVSNIKTQNEFSIATQDISVSPDKNYCLTGDEDGVITLYYYNTKKKILKIKGTDISPLSGNFAIFSSDSKKIIFTEEENIVVFDINKRGVVQKIHNEGDYAIIGLINGYRKNQLIVAYANGNLKLINDYDHPSEVRSVGRVNPIRLWKENVKLGQIITLADESNSLLVWSASTGKPLFSLTGHSDFVLDMDISMDGEILISGSADSIVKIWNLNNGQLINTLKGHSGEVVSVKFSSDKKFIISGGHEDSIAIIWETKTGKILQQLPTGGTYYQLDVFFDSSGKYAFIHTDKQLKVWDWRNKKLLKEHSENQVNRSLEFWGGLFDDKYYIIGTGDTIKVFSMDSKNEVLNYLPATNLYPLKSFHCDSSFFIMFYTIDTIKVINLNNRRVEWSEEIISPGSRLFINDSFNLINGKLVLENSNEKEYRYIRYKPTYLKHHKICNTDTFFYFKLPDPAITSVYRFFQVNDRDFIGVTAEGYYQTSASSAKLLHYVTKDLKVISFEQLDVKYNRPDKVLEAIGNTDTALIKSYRKAWEKRIKKLGIDTTAFRDGYSVPECDFVNRDSVEYEQKSNSLTLRIRGIDSTYQLDRFNVWVNESPVFGQRGISLKTCLPEGREKCNSIDTTITIQLSQGENRIECSITNVNGTESYRMPLYVNYTTAVKQKEAVRFIGIGIDRFKESSYNLQYSSKDIRDLALKLKEKYKDNIIIDTLFNEDVTTEKVKALKQKLQHTTVNDKVILSYSGHGLLSKDYDYYLSTYSVNFQKPEENGLPYDELESLLDSIPARKKLMLIDACHSGEVDKEEGIAQDRAADSLGLKKGIIIESTRTGSNLGLKSSFELMQSLFVNVSKSTGATIISAAAGNQFALERGDLKNGVFTYSLLEALNKYPSIKISELKKIVGERVEQLTNGMQKPTSRNENIAADWDIW